MFMLCNVQKYNKGWNESLYGVNSGFDITKIVFKILALVWVIQKTNNNKKIKNKDLLH